MDSKWDVISLISSGCQLNKCDNYMRTGNLVEKMSGEAQEWFKNDYNKFAAKFAKTFPPIPVLISAPTGSGKSTFVLKHLAKIVAGFGGRILLLTNRSGLCKDVCCKRWNEDFTQYSIAAGSFVVKPAICRF